MNEPVLAAPPARRPPPWWIAFAVVAIGSVVAALMTPSSWWGVAFVGAVVALMVTAKEWVPASYRGGWPRATVIVSVAAMCAGGAYAFAVEPFGPRGAVAWPFGGVLFGAVAVVATKGLGFGRGGVYTKLEAYDAAVWRGERLSGRR